MISVYPSEISIKKEETFAMHIDMKSRNCVKLDLLMTSPKTLKGFKIRIKRAVKLDKFKAASM